MDPQTRTRAHRKLDAVKDYIAYPKEILDDAKLEELYEGLEISPKDYFRNGINMSIWATNKFWKKIREKVFINNLHWCKIVLMKLCLN